MKEESLKQILNHIGKQAFPDDTDSWTPIKDRLVHNPEYKNTAHVTYIHPQRRLHLRYMIFGIVITLLITTTIFLFSPGGEALAETLRHLFQPVSVQQLPTLSSEAMASPTFAPTFAVTLSSILDPEPIITPLPYPTSQTTPELNPCDLDPYGYTCRIVNAERVAGFDAKEFPVDPQGFFFKTVSQAEPGVIWLEYDVIGGGGYLFLSQGLGIDFPAFTGEVPGSAIEAVQVSGRAAEYVAGVYVNGGVYTETTWLPCCRFRLRWTDDERWYEIDKEAALATTDYMTKDVMIQMAEQLVYQPVTTQGLRLDHLNSLAEASQVAEFAILAPSVLPAGFIFNYASYDKGLSQLRLNYAPPDGQGIAGIWIIETPLDKVSLSPGDREEKSMGESVDINGTPGVYTSTDPYHHQLTWQFGEVEITLIIYSSESWYGGSFTRDQILEIGRSIK